MGTAIPIDRPLEVMPDEAVVAELDTLLRRGLLAWNVRFTLTDQRAQLLPTRRLERLAGARGDAFYIDEIDDLTWGRVTRELHIKLRSRTLKLSGGGAWKAYQHLKALVAPDETQARAMAALRAFLPGEKVILEGPVDVVVRDPLWASGEVQLTTHRVRFKPGRGVQRLLLSGKPVEVRLADIEGIRITRGGTGLALLWQYEPEDGEGRELEVALEFVRGSMSALAAAFLAMGATRLRAGDPPPVEPIPLRVPTLVAAGRYGSGALARSGTLAVGVGGVWFTSADFVATVAGTSAEGLALVEINRIEVDQTNPRAAVLVPRGDAPSRAIETDKKALDPTALALLLASVPPVHGPVLDSRGRLDVKDVRNLARMNSALLPGDRRAGGVRGAGAVRIGRRGRITRGWLLMLQSGVLFLSAGGRAEDRCYLDGPLIDRSRSNTDDDGLLRIVAERREEVFAVCGGERTARELWMALWSHLPDARSMAHRYPYLEAVVGRVGYIRLSHRQREVVSRRMLSTHLEREGIGFLVGEEAPELLSAGLDVEVEMGNQEVVYCFRTHVARIDQRDEGAYVVVGLSSKVKRRDNRRRAFRVAIEQDLSLHRKASHVAEAEEVGLDGALANVSWTGLAVLLDDKLPVGALFSVGLTLEGVEGEYTAEVIHSRKTRGESRLLHGCRFLDLSAAREDHIQSAVIRQQMREVYAREIGLPPPQLPAHLDDAMTEETDRDDALPPTEKISRPG